MLRFKEYRQVEVAAIPVHPPENNLQDRINQVVDGWIKELKLQLVNPSTPQGQRRGLWDRFKNTAANLWHGRYSDKNPYLWQNKLGDDLGSTQDNALSGPAHQRTESNLYEFSLEEYKNLREICDSLEEAINEDGIQNLRIMRIIDAKAAELKTKLADMLGSESPVQPVVKPTVQPTEPTQSEPTQVASEEPDVKPSKPDQEGINTLKRLLELEFEKGELGIGQDQYDHLINDLSSPKRTERLKAWDAARELLNHVNKNKPTPTTPEPTPEPTSTTPEPTSTTNKSDGPMPIDSKPGGKKNWNELATYEQDAWDILGGGRQEMAKRIRGCAEKLGIKKIPWILRIGDPRIQLLKDQAGGKFKHIDGCRKAYSKLLNDLETEGRIESPNNPIKSWKGHNGLFKRIEAIKAKIQASPQEKDESPATKFPDAPIRPEEVGKTAAAPQSEPHQTSLLAAGLPPKSKEEKPDSMEEIKTKLAERIGKIQDETIRKQLIDELKQADNEHKLKIIQKDVDEFENPTSNFEWTVQETKDFYKKKLHEASILGSKSSKILRRKSSLLP